MDLEPETVSRVWWKGAISSALKGIPQGLMLGLGGAVVLGALCLAIPTLGGVFSGMLFGNAATLSIGAFSPMPFVALNAVLTVVGNFLIGGDMAVQAHKQEVEHTMNERRLDRLEMGEVALAQQIAPQRSRQVQQIIAQGPRAQAGQHAQAEVKREDQRLIAPESPTIH